MKGQFYKEKRHKLLEKVKDNSVVVLFFESSKVQHSLTSPGIYSQVIHQRKLLMKLIHLHQIEIFII